MATRLLFSFDPGSAPAGEVLPPPVLAAMGSRPRRRVLSRVWLLECADDADARDFSDALHAIQVAHPGFSFVALAWVQGSPDVYVVAQEAA